MKYKIIILGGLLLYSIYLHSQVIQASASLEKNNCLIGDQIQLKLNLKKSISDNILFPVLKDTITKSIEIISSSKIDTISKENQQIELQQTYTITSFDTGTISVPPLPFLFQRDSLLDTIYTNELLFTVHALPVDTTKAIFDIKPPINEPFSIKEILDKILISFIIILILAIAIYVYYRIKKNKPIIPIPQKPEDPPYVIALRELEKLKEKKLWQKQQYKQYYSELTDILRIYMEKQFSIPAMESVSSELIELLKNKNFAPELVKNMQSLFTTADFVKFAKAEPLPDENDWHLKNAFQFIEQTKPQEITTTSNEKKAEVNE